MDPQKNILLLDGDAQSASEMLQTLGESMPAYKAEHAPDLAGGINCIEAARPDLVLVDENFINANNFEPVKTRLSEGHIPYIFLSNVNGAQIIEQAERLGASELLVKGRITPYYLAKTINSTLKLNETEDKLNRVFEEYSDRIESFSLMLETLNEGVLIINRESALQYANNSATAIISDEIFNTELEKHLHFRPVEQEETIELRHSGNANFSIRVRNFFWNGEPCNLFIIDKKHGPAVRTEAFDAHHIIISVLNGIERNLLLLKNDEVEFVNNHAEKFFIAHGGGLTRKDVTEIFLDPGLGQTTASFVSPEQVLSAKIQFPGSAALNVDFQVRNLSIADEHFQILLFEKSTDPGHSAPDNFNGISPVQFAKGMQPGISQNLQHPVEVLVKEIELFANNLAFGKYQQAVEHAGFAESAMKKMKALIRDFHAFADLGNSAITVSTISMKDLINEVLEKAKPEIDSCEAEINISELPEVKADKELVQQLLANLLDNALKFRRKNKKPVIDIGHDFYEGSAIFCMRDNGIGISRKDHEKIFEPFVTLDVPGTTSKRGLGLAICRKIAELHGGKIWVESLPGHGSNFYFTLA